MTAKCFTKCWRSETAFQAKVKSSLAPTHLNIFPDLTFACYQLHLIFSWLTLHVHISTSRKSCIGCTYMSHWLHFRISLEKNPPQHLFGCHPEGQCPQVCEIHSSAEYVLKSDRHNTPWTIFFSLGDARGEEPGDLMPASTADNLSQGDLHHQQGGQGGEQEPQGNVEKSWTGHLAPLAGPRHCLRGANASRDPSWTSGSHPVHEVLRLCAFYFYKYCIATFALFTKYNISNMWGSLWCRIMILDTWNDIERFVLCSGDKYCGKTALSILSIKAGQYNGRRANFAEIKVQ